ncbi:MAG: lamin tail domain-containing protein [Planctomycetota bacterium]|jgi:hypothetical protein
MTESRKARVPAVIALLGMSLMVFATSARATDDHLLLCEITLTPTSDEFIEITNPTGTSISLENYYLSDDADYALLAGQFGAGPAPAIGSSDFITRFPPGSSIPAGGVVVVAFDGAGFNTTFGFAADFEVGGTDAGTPDMVEGYPGSVGATFGLTNSGESVRLFFWDGASDLVQDVDLLNVGTPSATNAIISKTGVSVDGPDGDTIPTTYLVDSATMPQQVADPGFGFSTKRSLVEAGQETTGGGNGITGDDETSEQISATWDAAFTAPTPGSCDAGSGEPSGACCDTITFTCTDGVLQSNCQGTDETFSAGQICADVICAPIGACCVTGQCYGGVDMDSCTQLGGSFEGGGTDCGGTSCAAPNDVLINEIRIDDTGDPEEEYFELLGSPTASLDGLTYLVLGEDSNQVNGSGVIEAVVSLDGGSINSSGFFTVAESTFSIGVADLTAVLGFENSDNVTHLLVSGFTGALDDDLDSDDDGLLDSTPWSSVLDCISLIETVGSGDLTYCAAELGPDGTFVPGHALRCGDGGQWQIGDFFVDNDDTPGDTNAQVCGGCCEGASCFDDRTADDCSNTGGSFQGEGSDCGAINCAIGACCTGGSCADGLDEGTCSLGGGVFQGAGTECVGVNCTSSATVVISEIMYNPSSSEAVPNQVEWVEIYNAGVVPVDISGWYLADEDGETTGLPGGSEIDGGEAVVFIPNEQTVTEYQDAWGIGYQIFAVGGWGVPGLSSLSNSPSATNEILTLRDAGGVAIDVVNFDDEGDWPSDAEGDGPSIRALCTALDAAANDLGTNWIHSILGVNGAVASVAGGDFGPDDIGSPGIVVCPEEGIGACCQADETCFETSEKFCDKLNLTFFGEGSTCADTVCPPVGGTGACCTEGLCEDDVSELLCDIGGGTWFGDTSTCAGLLPEDCPEASPLIISEFVEGTLDANDGFGPSNAPRFVELTNVGCGDINMAAYSIGNFNNGALTLGGGSSTQLSGTLPAGASFIFCYCAENVEPPVIDVFFDLYGFAPDAFAGGGFVNGNDNVALFRGVATGGGADATLVDVYGNIGEAEDAGDFSMDWANVDTVARRNPDVLAPTSTFDILEWTIDPQGSLLGADDAESAALLLANTDPGFHENDQDCGGGGETATPLADERFDVTGAIKGCATDAECKDGETGPDPETVCRDSDGDGINDSCYVARARYLSVKVNPANAGGNYAYRISLDTGVAGASVLGFVGMADPTAVTGPGPSLFYLSRIDDTPHYMDWTTLTPGYVTIGDCEVSPGNSYVIQTIAEGADTGDEGNYSGGLNLPTPANNGDVTGGGNPGDPPNGATGSLVDVFSMIKAFQATQNEPKDWLDYEPQVPNMVHSLADAFQGILAFQLNPYPFSAPLDCP